MISRGYRKVLGFQFSHQYFRKETKMTLYRRKNVICEDGFEMSVQASSFHYSTPKLDGFNTIYSTVEIGFPSESEELIAIYAENKSDLLNTVYPYVPALMVVAVINKHGGMISGELPELSVPSQPTKNGHITPIINYYDVDVDECGPFITVNFDEEE